MKKFFGFLVLLAIVAGAAWYFAGRASGPAIVIESPEKAIGQTGQLSIAFDAPGARLTAVDVAIEQGEKRLPIFTLPGGDPSLLVREGENRLMFVRSIGKRELPDLERGPARLTVTAARPVLFGLRNVESAVTRDIEVRLTPPTVGVLSTHHYINHGGSEMVVYRVSPADVSSGVRVGDREYPGFPAAGAGIANADPGLRVAFFALLWDQDVNTPISLFARDDVGNEGAAALDYRVFPKKFRQSRIELDDRFLARVVPAILQNTPELNVSDSSDLLGSFLTINRELRRQNNARIAALASNTSPEILWEGPFKQLINTAVEGGFADQRTYFYKGQEVDRQVHLGFDLASTATAPVVAANRGKVVHAGWLGIYGNCVILDHGMGLQSLYAHLSSIEVKEGDDVADGARLGRSGATGLAGGDHLHFTLLLNGQAVTPIDWWSRQWVQDRILRKLREAGATLTSAAAESRTAG
jgi:murein DD-endopeptidase MepM/ murein hydrolase activator NlpD